METDKRLYGVIKSVGVLTGRLKSTGTLTGMIKASNEDYQDYADETDILDLFGGEENGNN
jgi:hypothetical protein|nr:MAG TPA: hypothetical protein [Caudoviricetes sp.]